MGTPGGWSECMQAGLPEELGGVGGQRLPVGVIPAWALNPSASSRPRVSIEALPMLPTQVLVVPRLLF